MGNPRQPGQLVHLNALRRDEKETRRAEAWTLRLEGYTIRQIAERLCVSISVAAEYLQSTLAELRADSRESADSWRQIQLDRLDAVVATWLPVCHDPTNPEAARAAAIIVKAVEAQSRLLGLLQSMADVPLTHEKGPTLEEALRDSPALVEAMQHEIAKAKGRTSHSTS